MSTSDRLPEQFPLHVRSEAVAQGVVMSLFDPFPRDEPRPSPPPDLTKRPERRCKPCDVRWSMNDGDTCWACGQPGDAVPALAYYPHVTYVHHDTGEAAPA